MKAGISFIIISILAFLITSCNTNEPVPPLEKPPGYQDDVPWPSLADSPWPMFRADPQNTGRSKFLGPQLGTIEKSIDAYNLQSSAVIDGSNNLIFIETLPSAIINHYNLINGRAKKDTIGFDNFTTAVVGSQNSFYVFSEPYLIKYDLNGSLIWSLTLNSSTLSASLQIDKEENIIYIGDDRTINSISKDGQLNWSVAESRLLINPYHAPAFSPDGKILYLQGESVSLIAFDIEQQMIKWVFGNERLASGPVVDSQGNIYITPSQNSGSHVTLFSLTNSGNLRWNKDLFAGNYTSEEPSIDKLGNIIIGLGDSLYSFDHLGNQNWKTFLGNNISALSPVIDNEGNIFLPQWNPNKVSAFSRDGLLLWDLLIENERSLLQPLITSNSKLLIPSFRSYFIYIIK